MYPKQALKKDLEAICPGRVRPKEPLGPYTTIRIGGKADWLIQPQTHMEIKKLRDVAEYYATPWQVLGQGSNLLVSDRGIRGLVIHLTLLQGAIKMTPLKNGKVLLEVEAGVPLAQVIRFGLKRHLAGLEFLAGIPGSMGGAWAMNAGSYGKEMKDLTTYLKVFSKDGRLVRKEKRHLSFSYRRLLLEPGEMILAGGITVFPGEDRLIKQEIRKRWALRRTAQPLTHPSCGSVFKNPPGDFAGRLIEEAGLKGLERGKAQISSRHANFIINKGGARAKDVLGLMNLIRRRVHKQSGVLLEPEVRLWGCTLKEIH